ncbi:MAG TPA: hypothetical protein VKR59_04955 [Terriglobales bacterium]|nr:hypothetical protein [Terriglobales bacterium]
MKFQEKSFIRIALLAVLAASLTGMIAAQVPAGAKRPSVVPANYLITPFGYFHPSCVGHLAKGDEILHDEKLIKHVNGTTESVHVCAYARFEADGTKVAPDGKIDNQVDKPPFIGHSWIEYASVTTTTSFGYLYAEWTVPPTPTSNDGQTVYFFPGVEDINDVVTIIQPVLGWNSDYASAWGIASWNCCESGTTYEATPEPVSSGDTILGYMFDTCAAGTKTCTSWDIVTWDLQNGKFSELLNTSNFGQTFNWAFAGALEVYNITQCSDYPSNGGYPGSNAMSFNELGLFNDKFVQIASPNWKISNVSGGLTPQCGYGGTTPKQVILTF